MKTRDERVADLYFVAPASPGDPTEEGQVRIYNGDLVIYIEGSVKSLTTRTSETEPTQVSGLTEAQHRALYQLIHFIDEGPSDGFLSGAFKETLPQGDPFPTSITWYTSSSKTIKIVERTITRSGGGATVVAPTPITWTMYDANGDQLAKVIDDVTYVNNVFEYQRTRTIKILQYSNQDTVGVSDGFTIELNP